MQRLQRLRRILPQEAEKLRVFLEAEKEEISWPWTNLLSLFYEKRRKSRGERRTFCLWFLIVQPLSAKKFHTKLLVRRQFV